MDTTDGMPTLKDIFIFLTGCDTIPPLGFIGADQMIEFDSEEVVPKVSTCSLVFHLPIGLPSEYEDFKERLIFFILGSQGFGQL